MRLNNKGFAISSIMYIILVMAILIITVTLSVLSSRKLVLDKLKSEILNKINQDIELSYSDTLKKIKEATQSYINDGHNIDDTYIDSVSIDNLKVNNYLSISDKVLNYYNLNDKYVGFKNSNSIYSFMIGKEVDYNDLKGDLLDIVDYHIEGQSVQNGTPTPDTPVEVESVGDLVTLDNCESYGGEACNNIGKYVIPMKVTGKNLFDIDGWYNWLRTYTTEYVVKDTVDGTEVIYYRPPLTYNKFWMKGQFKEKTKYIISFRAKGIVGNGVSTGVRFVYTNGTISSCYVANEATWKDYTCVSSAGKTIDHLEMNYNYGQGCYFDINSMLLEEGSSATEYEPYKGTITNIYLDEPLRKVGDYADYIDFKSGKVVRRVVEDVFKSQSENTTSYGGKRFNYWNSNVPQEYGRVLSNKIETYKAWWYDSYTSIPSKYLIQTNPTAGLISIITNDETLTAMNYSEFGEWCKNNNVRIMYAIIDPKEQSMDFQNIVVRGGNKIEIDTSVKPSNVTYKVVEKMFDINV